MLSNPGSRAKEHEESIPTHTSFIHEQINPISVGHGAPGMGGHTLVLCGDTMPPQSEKSLNRAFLYTSPVQSRISEKTRARDRRR